MGSRSGREMRKLVVSVTIMVMTLVLVILIYFLADVVVTSRKNMKENRELVVRKTAEQMRSLGKGFENPAALGKFYRLFDPQLINTVLETRDVGKVVEIALMFTQSLAPAVYTEVFANGKPISRVSEKDNLSVEGLQDEVPEEGYRLLEGFAGLDGYYVAVNYRVDLSALGMGTLNIISVTDKTADIREVDDYFRHQRNGTLIRLAIAAVLALMAAFLITTSGLRFFTRRYVTRPMEELNRMAQEIADGTFRGEVAVDRDSSFAALQGLLRSGQLVLRRMEEKLKE